VLTRSSADTLPIWMQEGIAKFEEQRWRQATGTPMEAEAESLLAGAQQDGSYISFAAMHPSIAKLPSQQAAALAFAEVRSVIELIVQRKGYAALRSIIAEMKSGTPESAALKDVLGEDEDGLWSDWRSYIAGKSLRLHPGLELAKIKLAPAPSTGGGARDDDEDGIDDISEKTARDAARLGGLLRLHHRLAAAAVEYEKAEAMLGPQNELITSRLAHTYLELGEAQKAIDTAKPTADLYPDAAGPHATMGEAYLSLGDDTDAANELWAALRISPYDPDVHCGLARIYQEQSDTANAERESGFCSELGGMVPAPSVPAAPPSPP
jgi:tetratricopeptide (TPR) repeat protein